MTVALGRLGQATLPTRDVDRSEAFYGTALGLKKLYRYGDLAFFDCDGVRLLLEKVRDPAQFADKGICYFAIADIALARKDPASRGVKFNDEEAPKGYQPPRD